SVGDHPGPSTCLRLFRGRRRRRYSGQACQPRSQVSPPQSSVGSVPLDIGAQRGYHRVLEELSWTLATSLLASSRYDIQAPFYLSCTAMWKQSTSLSSAPGGREPVSAAVAPIVRTGFASRRSAWKRFPRNRPTRVQSCRITGTRSRRSHRDSARVSGSFG